MSSRRNLYEIKPYFAWRRDRMSKLSQIGLRFSANLIHLEGNQ